jgi:hypothetical protein
MGDPRAEVDDRPLLRADEDAVVEEEEEHELRLRESGLLFGDLG